MDPKRKLLIKAGTIDNQSKVVPVNTGDSVAVQTDLGSFDVSVFIRNFDGSVSHHDNSLYNASDETYINGSRVQESKKSTLIDLPNLRILIKFKPNSSIKGSQLFFGNECSVPVRDYVPTTIMSSGLRLFKWFLNPTIESDLYGEKPYIYGLALNSFSKVGLASSTPVTDFLNHENENLEWGDQASNSKPPSERRKHFLDLKNSESFTFGKEESYYLLFDTNFLKLGDSMYNVCIPAIGNQTFDVNVLRFARDNLDNINWTIKKSAGSTTAEGSYGLVLNFRLVEEQN